MVDKTIKCAPFYVYPCFLTRVLTRSSSEGQNADGHSISAFSSPSGYFVETITL